MNTAFLRAFCVVLFVFLSGRSFAGRDGLRSELESVYARYQEAIEMEDPAKLKSVFTKRRLDQLRGVFAVNGMKFPADYFLVVKEVGTRLPALDGLGYVGLDRRGNLVNLVYTGSLRGFLRRTTDEKCFLIVQFESEGGDWKYAACSDFPLCHLPGLEKKLAAGESDFLNRKPFKADRIELLPEK